MKPNEISDGFGNCWEKCKLGADCGLHVVRPGKAQCWCEDQEASRCEVQAAREEIENLETSVDQLERENAALRRENVRLLEAVLHQSDLRADRDRLDWLLTHEGGSWLYWAIENGQWSPEVGASRSAIDAARKEAQP